MSTAGAGDLTYLDYNATTPVAPEVLEVISTALKDHWANPSSRHNDGLAARQCINDARASVAKMIGADPLDIIFTSGGTEANNMVLNTIASHKTGTDSTPTSPLPHVIISNLEHYSVQLAAQHLHQTGAIDLTVVSADPQIAQVHPEEVVSRLRPETRLVCLVLANNETGVIQPVGEVVREIRLWEQRQDSKGRREEKILVHTDAAQALGKVTVDARELGVDYLSIVGHKFYGPRIGALYVRGLDSKATPLLPMLYGGGQERGYRSGTENTGMIAGLGKAAELVTDHVLKYEDHLRSVRDYLETQLVEVFGQRVHFNGKYEESQRIPNTCNFSIVGKQFRGHSVLSKLEHCHASVGPACHSHLAKASPVLLACGVPEDVALNALRVSVGRETTTQDIDIFINDMKQAIKELDA